MCNMNRILSMLNAVKFFVLSLNFKIRTFKKLNYICTKLILNSFTIYRIRLALCFTASCLKYKTSLCKKILEVLTQTSLIIRASKKIKIALSKIRTLFFAPIKLDFFNTTLTKPVTQSRLLLTFLFKTNGVKNFNGLVRNNLEVLQDRGLQKIFDFNPGDKLNT